MGHFVRERSKDFSCLEEDEVNLKETFKKGKGEGGNEVRR